MRLELACRKAQLDDVQTENGFIFLKLQPSKCPHHTAISMVLVASLVFISVSLDITFQAKLM
jgi:hypothetical protein